ncbi:Crp/Fnr family transcriptional regulator [Listeria booriae]|uniref:Crp/Fnr family transcriptional regulator n=1 Tax=Listeria booriae TaxID=1552123 RepID=UPI00162A6E29|nr:Crp/Fnr family transcriptional regulator [Listeria booriae]MBC1888720.1 Crp/Fnr family transcriptional regulator [Listeria booriae]
MKIESLEQSGVSVKYAKKAIISTVDTSFIIESGYVAVLNVEGDVIDFLGAGSEMVQVDSLVSHSFEVISNELHVTKYDGGTVAVNETSTNSVSKEVLIHLPTEQRVSQALFQLGMRYGGETGDPTLIRFPRAINKGRIAQYTNLNPNTVTKVLKKLQVEGVLYNTRREMHMNIIELELKVASISQ